MTLSLYNKYRPQTFKEVVGQAHIETTLANAVEKGKVSHAYLFCGPRGTGKTTTARILAKALLCDKAPTPSPDGTCESCREISEGIHPDVYELDAASRTSVENVREEIVGRVNFAPTHGKYKIYIIDEVHMLSTSAFNALLKTLEEPPSHVIFVLCTTDAHKVIDTVQARCQRFDFKRLTTTELVGRLRYICEREGFDSEPAALELIAQRSQGGMRDAIRSLEQIAVFSNGKITYTAAESLLGMADANQLFALCDYIAANDTAACFGWVADYVQSGSDIAILVNDLAQHIRNLYVVKVSNSTDKQLISSLEIDEAALPRFRMQAKSFSTPERLRWMFSTVGELSSELKSAVNARLALEITLARILRPESEASLDALLVRVAELEQRIAAGETGNSAPVNRAAASVVENPETTSAVGSADISDAAQELADLPDASEQLEAKQDISPSPALIEETPEEDFSEEQALYRKWHDVVEAIRKNKHGLVAASLGGAVPKLNKDGTRLTLELPAGATPTKQLLEKEANKTLVSNMVEKVFGKPLALVYTLATGGENPGRELQPESATREERDGEASVPAKEVLSEEPGKETTAGSMAEEYAAEAAGSMAEEYAAEAAWALAEELAAGSEAAEEYAAGSAEILTEEPAEEAAPETLSIDELLQETLPPAEAETLSPVTEAPEAAQQPQTSALPEELTKEDIETILSNSFNEVLKLNEDQEEQE